LLSATAIDPARIAQEAAMLASAATSAKSWIACGVIYNNSEIIGWRRRAREKIGFSPARNASRSQHHAFQDSGVESEALKITGIGLEVKAEIEKLREQVQNIE